MPTVHLSRFAFEAIAGEQEESSKHVPAMMVRAVRSYLNDRDSGRPGWSYPPFLRDREAAVDVKLEVSIDEQLWRSLEEEADRQGVSVSQMVEHVALYFAAEADSGRIAERIVDDLDDDAEEERP